MPPIDQAIVNAELAKAVCAVVVVEDISCHDAVRNGTVTGKLTALLVASGMPGIAVSSKSGEIRHLVSKVPNWYGVDSVEQCVNALKQLISEDKSNVLDRNALQNYHMDNQVKVLYALIQSAQE